MIIAIIPDTTELNNEAIISANIMPTYRIPVIYRDGIIGNLTPSFIKPDEIISGIYRGYMLTDNTYKLLYEHMLLLNIKLIINPTMYNIGHYYPYTFPYLLNVQDIMPRSVFFPIENGYDMEAIGTALSWKSNYIMIKDYVKSAKEKTNKFNKIDKHNVDICEFIDDFIHTRKNIFNIGIVIKEYVELKKYNYRGQIITNEWRYFFANHNMISLDPNSWQQNIIGPNITERIKNLAKEIPSLYITIDVAEKTDNTWIILEIGDGGVSGPSTGMDISLHWKCLKQSFDL